MNEEWLHLVHGEIDGMNSSADSERLRRLMDEHPELKKLYADMAALQDSLKNVVPAEPPANMTFRIMNEVRHPTGARRPRPFVSPRWRFAFGFGLGLAAAWMATFFVLERPTDNRYLGGVMTRWDADYRIVDSSMIYSDSLRADVKGGHSSDRTRISLALNSRMPVDIALEWDPKRWTVRSFECDRPAHVTMSPDGMVIRHDGSNGYAVTFAIAEPVASIEFSIASGTRVLFHHRFFSP
jgi:hypothetical protein